MRHRVWYLFMLIPGLVACGERQSDLMPLRVGQQSTYVVNAGFAKMVDPLKVTREVPVGGTTGYELSGSFGTSRLVWTNGQLVATQTANAFFDPPIPLLTVDGKPVKWSGKIEAMGRRSAATATLEQKSDQDLQIGTKTYTTRATELTIHLPRGTIVINSWFAPGVGLVQQEQRTNDQFVLRMELLNGPTTVR